MARRLAFKLAACPTRASETAGPAAARACIGRLGSMGGTGLGGLPGRSRIGVTAPGGSSALSPGSELDTRPRRLRTSSCATERTSRWDTSAEAPLPQLFRISSNVGDRTGGATGVEAALKLCSVCSISWTSADSRWRSLASASDDSQSFSLEVCDPGPREPSKPIWASSHRAAAPVLAKIPRSCATSERSTAFSSARFFGGCLPPSSQAFRKVASTSGSPGGQRKGSDDGGCGATQSGAGGTTAIIWNWKN
mmetsp:Transcript_53410/g.117252  ORF Transcript_53410/g.117252 Transcript_53410/m.117252 type:complete len:251 (-) Transcript_53410:17-769(-)